MEANIVIRPARTADADELQRNCKTAAALEQVKAQLAWTTRERGPHVLEHLVAEVDGEVVGTVMTFPKGAHALQFANGWITQCRGRNPPVAAVVRLDDWVVNARFHGTGVAVRLAEEVLQVARTWGVGQVESSSANPRAIGCLAKLGFREWGRYPHRSGATEVFVVRDL